MRKESETGLKANEILERRYAFFATVNMYGREAHAVPVIESGGGPVGLVAHKEVIRKVQCYDEGLLLRATNEWS